MIRFGTLPNQPAQQIDTDHALLVETFAEYLREFKIAVDGKVNSKQDKSEEGIADGYASLDATGNVPLKQIPDNIPELEISGNSNY